MIAYLFEFSTLLALFGLCYLLFLKRTSNYKLQRHYLLGSIFISLFLPLVPDLFHNELLVYSIVLPEVNIIAYGIGKVNDSVTPGGRLDWQFVGIVLFALVTLVFALRFIYALLQIAKIIFQAKADKSEGYTLLKSQQIKSPFSFFKYVIIPDNLAMAKEELQIIIDHELLHIRFNHSLEKILLELFKVCFWWHPVAWLYKKEIELIHEYQVDDAMTQDMEHSIYKKILLQLVLHPQDLRLVNPISSNIKKRLSNMNQKKNSNGPFRFIGLFMLIAIGSLFIHSCQQEDNADQVIEQTNVTKVKTPAQSDPYELTTIDTFVMFDSDTLEETVEIGESKQMVYITPEKMPLFPGCDSTLPYEELRECSNQKMLEYIYTNLIYPQKSRINGIEGMVVVRFVVSEHGFVYNKDYLRSPDNHLQKAVDNMLIKMNKDHDWIPGEQDGKKVNVQYTLPVKFKLEG